MTGYQVVFDREKLVLGWKKFDCGCHFHLYTCHFSLSLQITFLIYDQTFGAPNAGYDVDDYSNLSETPSSTTVPPAVAAGLGNYSMPKSTKEIRTNGTSSASPSYYCLTTPMTCFRFLIMFYLLLFTQSLIFRPVFVLRKFYVVSFFNHYLQFKPYTT